MSQNITATFENGVLKPHENLDLPAGTQVELVVTPCAQTLVQEADPLIELDRLCENEPIQPGGTRLTRDQLHERR